jgi:hypothetical protein
MNEAFMFYVLICIGLAIAAVAIAAKKGYNHILAGVITGLASLASFWIGGVITIIIYAIVPHKKNPCPHCGNRIVHSATKCPHCGHAIPAKPTT